MEKFLRAYVKMHAECMDIKLNNKKLAQIVNNLMNEDYIWEVLDSAIGNELENLE